jgi:hypothetical protein
MPPRLAPAAPQSQSQLRDSRVALPCACASPPPAGGAAPRGGGCRRRQVQRAVASAALPAATPPSRDTARAHLPMRGVPRPPRHARARRVCRESRTRRAPSPTLRGGRTHALTPPRSPKLHVRRPEGASGAVGGPVSRLAAAPAPPRRTFLEPRLAATARRASRK